MSSLELLLTDGVIEEVVTRLKSGKEADLYLVQHRGEIVAAKLYKERHARNFHNNVAYREGRTVRNTRTQRAMDKGSRFGQAAAEEAWKATESDALHRLHAVGMRVPQPILFYEGVLLMEVVVDAEGHPAPRLIDAHVPVEVAAPFYADLRSQVIRMLTCDLIHGDLSPYNVLLAWNGPTIIDFPQVIGAAHNRQAASFFERDLRTLHRFFASVDPSLEAHAGDAHKIWRAYERRELTPDFVPSPGDATPRRHKGKARRGVGAEGRGLLAGGAGEPRGVSGNPAPRRHPAAGPVHGAEPRGTSHGRGGEPRGPRAQTHGRGGEPRAPHAQAPGRGGELRGPHAQNHGRGGEPRGSQAQPHGRGGELRGPHAQNHGRGGEPRGSQAQTHGRGGEPRGPHAQNHGRGGEAHGSQAQTHGRGGEPRGGPSPNHARGAEPRGSHAPPHGRGGESRGPHAQEHGRGAEPRGGPSPHHARGADPRGGRPGGRPQGRNGSGGELPRGPQVERRPALGGPSPHAHRGGPPRKNEPR